MQCACLSSCLCCGWNAAEFPYRHPAHWACHWVMLHPFTQPHGTRLAHSMAACRNCQYRWLIQTDGARILIINRVLAITAVCTCVWLCRLVGLQRIQLLQEPCFESCCGQDSQLLYPSWRPQLLRAEHLNQVCAGVQEGRHLSMLVVQCHMVGQAVVDVLEAARVQARVADTSTLLTIVSEKLHNDCHVSSACGHMQGCAPGVNTRKVLQ
mmetsp:Transcript_38963/g.86687  ORF Transcript_38963/g.86687 Transcript_38963/m.86687 type:complete len:210 (+) Transcript_38963:916-1545(+)